MYAPTKDPADVTIKRLMGAKPLGELQIAMDAELRENERAEIVSFSANMQHQRKLQQTVDGFKSSYFMCSTYTAYVAYMDKNGHRFLAFNAIKPGTSWKWHVREVPNSEQTFIRL